MADAMDPKVDYMSLDVPNIFSFTLVELCTQRAQKIFRILVEKNLIF